MALVQRDTDRDSDGRRLIAEPGAPFLPVLHQRLSPVVRLDPNGITANHRFTIHKRRAPKGVRKTVIPGDDSGLRAVGVREAVHYFRERVLGM